MVAEEGVFYRRPAPESGRAEDGGTRRQGDKETDTASSLPVSLSPCLLVSLSSARPLSLPGEGVVPPNAEEAAANVRALASSSAAEAERCCAEALQHFPLAAESGYLRGFLLIDLGRDEEAIEALRRVLYLDHNLAVVHFALGSVLSRQGHGDGTAGLTGMPATSAPPARPARAARRWCLRGPLAEAAAARLAQLDAPGGAS